MNFRSILTLLLWGIIAWLLVRSCSPESTAPTDHGSLDVRLESFASTQEQEKTFVLENELVWSKWTTAGAGCLEVRLKEFAPELGSEESLVVFEAVPEMPPPAGQGPTVVHYRKRLGLRVFEVGDVLGGSPDAAQWSVEVLTESRELLFTVTSASGVLLTKRVRLPESRYHFDVELTAASSSSSTIGKTLAMRVGTGGGMLREEDAFYRNPYAAAAIMEYGSVEDMETYYPDGSLPDRRDMASRWNGEIPYVVEGSKYFLSLIRALDQPFQGAVAEVLWDETAREDAIFKGLSPEDRSMYREIGVAEWAWRKAHGNQFPSGEDLADDLELDAQFINNVLSDYRMRLQQGSSGEYWSKTSVSGDFSLHLGRPEDAPEKQRIQWYVGPKSPEALADYGPAATAAEFADYGSSFFYKLFFTNHIAPAILGILKFFQSIVTNWGVAIILLTLLVRGSLMPLNRKSQLKMAEYQVKMKKVKPMMDAINTKFAKDPQRKQQETMKLYKKYKVSPPLGGCLPIFIQMPIFIGLFAALRSSILLRQEGFVGWITDLSRPDALIDFGGPIADVFLLRSVTSFNLLPIVMVILWVVHQKSMPKQVDPQQAQMQKMMTWMPVLFGIMLYNYAAGLSLYMIVSSAVGIFEAKIIKKKWPVAVPESGGKKAG
ncbi:MAG: membrane protein insertase YidC [Planctomycetota bacterium]|nr:membrane protein insertase YidC [Planctomycetota bacterium]